MSIQQKASFVKPKGNKFVFIVLFRDEKYDKRKVSILLFVQVKSGRKENFLLPRKTLTKADKKDKI